MTEGLTGIIERLPLSALEAMASDASGELRDLLLDLLQVVQASGKLLVSAPSSEGDAWEEWLGEAEAVLLRTQFLLTSRVEDTPSGHDMMDNVHTMTRRLRESSRSASMTSGPGREVGGPPKGRVIEMPRSQLQ